MINQLGIVDELLDPNTDFDRLCQLIIDIEAEETTREQEKEVLPFLRRFIKDNLYDTNRLNRLKCITVGSAIRKYIASMPINDIESVAPWLAPASGKSHSDIPLIIELEIVKMIARKFVANPNESANLIAPELEAQLTDIADAYLNPRILAKAYHGSIALNAMHALILMDAHKIHHLMARVDLCPAWFGEQLDKRTTDQT